MDYLNNPIGDTTILSGCEHNTHGLSLDKDILTQYELDSDNDDLFLKKLGKCILHPDYQRFAGRLLLRKLFDETPNTIEQYVEKLSKTLNEEFSQFCLANSEQINALLKETRHLYVDGTWLAINTTLKNYLKRSHYSEPVRENPQQLNFRLAAHMWMNKGFDHVAKCYRELSDKQYTHSSPTMFNAGTNKAQCSSCFLIQMDDSLDRIYWALAAMSSISKNSGGIGVSMETIRHSDISNTGPSQGIPPILKQLDLQVPYVNQGGRRKGAITFYIQPHHIDFRKCLSMIEKGNKILTESTQLNEIQMASWTPWLLFKRAISGEMWTFMDPKQTSKMKGLIGKDFETQYCEYENMIEKDPSSFIHDRIPAETLLKQMAQVAMTAGNPYILNADSSNMKSNQQNRGYIKCSNLCTEIIEYTSEDEIASCNLGAINLKRFVIKDGSEMKYDFDKLGMAVGNMVRNLNQVIDTNYIPHTKLFVVKEYIEKSNKSMRPLGIGCSGFADAVYMLDLTFAIKDEKTGKMVINPYIKRFNKLVFGCKYFNALIASVAEAIKYGPYEWFEGSPYSKGKLQFDLWKDEYDYMENNGFKHNVREPEDDIPADPSDWEQKVIIITHNDTIVIIEPTWDSLRNAIIQHGVRNSLLLALMPTASTSQHCDGNTESFEAPTSNLYARKLITGTYSILNPHMVKDLEAIGAWNEKTLELLKINNGSITMITKFINANRQHYKQFHDYKRLEYLRCKYLTMFEIPQKIMLTLHADRSRYIDQSASFNIYFRDTTPEKLVMMWIYAYDLGCKTIQYYLRQEASSESTKYTVNQRSIKAINELSKECLACS